MLLAAIILLLAACGKDTKPPKKIEEQQKPDPSQENNQEEDEDNFAFRFPLTGNGTDNKPEERAVAVMINNHPLARQQSGLSQADVVYEVLAEGEVTRFLAIFQSEKPDNIGPVRSARDYYIDLAQGYRALYIAHGYSPDAQKMLASGRYDQLNGMQHDGTLFKRAGFRKAPHNSYISFENIEKGAERQKYDMSVPPAPLEFMDAKEAEADLPGTPAPRVQVVYSGSKAFTNEYRYDENAGAYNRYSGGVQTEEYETKEPVRTENLLVAAAVHKVIDNKGRRAIDFSSGGKAILFQKGKAKELEWRNVEGRILPYENGAPAKLIPGKTWISIVPSLNSISYGE